MVESVVKNTAWNAAKVKSFRAAFMNFLNYVKVDSKEKGPIILGEHIYGAQKRFLDCIFEGLAEDIHDFKILKSRQLGITTLSRALSLFWLGMHPGLKGSMVFDTNPHRDEARNEFVTMLRNLPDHLGFPKLVKDGRDLLSLSNGSTFVFLSAGVRSSKASGTLGRSSGLNFVHASEMCSWQNEEGVVSFRNSLSENFPNRLYIWESPLALDTPVPTPNGWTTMGRIKEGQHVYDENGKVCKVVGVSPVFINRKCYEITFGSGDSIVADEGHKWQVEERRWPTNPQWKTKVVTTGELDPEKHRILTPEPLDMSDIELPIDPYLLGVWLGDGLTGQAAITTGDEDIQEMRGLLEARGVVLGPVSKNNWRVGKFTALGQRSVFIRLGLLGNKHIPAAYLRASERQRRELLAGLMDTDGYISKDNYRCEFCSTLPKLVDQVAELLSSLGIKYNRSVCSEEGNLRLFPSGKTYACSASERLRFCEDPSHKVFNLRRKKDVQNLARGFTWRKAKYVKISSVTKVASVPVKCISVDTPTHLFLVGKTMLPTHNTARGFNQWYRMWLEAKSDNLNQRTCFIGWWAKDSQMIPRGTPMFAKYGAEPPTEEEAEKIKEVETRYGHRITQEQLAWIRRKTNPTQGAEGSEETGAGELEELMQQEQPFTEEDSFLQTGSTFFSSERLTDITKKDASSKYQAYYFAQGSDFLNSDWQPSTHKRNQQLKVWQEPDPDGIYVLACDPAFGHDESNNNSAVEVLRCYADCVEQVAEYAYSGIETEPFAWVIASLAGWYKNSYLIVEINGPGEAVWIALKELKKLVLSGHLKAKAAEKGLRDIFSNVRDYMYARSDSNAGPGGTMQWKTSGSNKVGLLERLRDFVTNGGLILRSFEVIEEMKTVIRNGDVIAAEGRNRDDRTFCLAMGIRAWTDSVRRMMSIQGRTKEVEAAKRRLTVKDQITMFNKHKLDGFFKVKQGERQRTAAVARRLNWRGK